MELSRGLRHLQRCSRRRPGTGRAGPRCREAESVGATPFLSPAALKVLPPGGATLVPGCSAAAFLSQTVIDDARLLLLEGSCSSHDKARSLASFGLLAATAGATLLTRAELLAQYLAAADVLLDAAIDSPEAGAQQQQQLQQHARGKGGGKLVAAAVPSGSQQSGEKLIAAVRILQTAILDAHLLFFKSTELAPLSPTASASKSPAVAAAAGAGSVDGLVALYQATFLRDVDAALTALPASLGAAGKGDMVPVHDAGAMFLAHARGAGSSGAEVRRVFDEWLGKRVLRLGAWSSGALAGMGSALEVARLQQRVWVAATQANAGTTTSEGPLNGDGQDTAQSVVQKDWAPVWRLNCVPRHVIRGDFPHASRITHHASIPPPPPTHTTHTHTHAHSHTRVYVLPHVHTRAGVRRSPHSKAPATSL